MRPDITQEEFEQPRTQEQLRRWVDSVWGEYGATEEGKRRVRLSQGPLMAKFFDEAWPIAVFADGFYRQDANVVFILDAGNESYDARIEGASTGHTVRNLQITRAWDQADGQQNHFRMRLLDRDGRAPLTATIERPAKGSPLGQPEPIAIKGTTTKLLSQITTALERKISSRPESNTDLIVEIDDCLLGPDDDLNWLDQYMHVELASNESAFDSVFLVKDAKRIARQYSRDGRLIRDGTGTARLAVSPADSA
jgi:hypothetical protein